MKKQNATTTDRLCKTFRCTIIDGSRISESEAVVGAPDLLRVYTLATLTNDRKMANAVFEALRDSKTDWKNLTDLVDSGDTFDTQGAQDLVCIRCLCQTSYESHERLHFFCRL